MSADNRNLRVPRARTRQTGGELVGPDNVESRYTNDLAVVEAQLLVVLTHGRNHESSQGSQSLPPFSRDRTSHRLRGAP